MRRIQTLFWALLLIVAIAASAGNGLHHEHEEGSDLNLLCFVWMTCSPREQELLHVVYHQLSRCNATYYFTDSGAPQVTNPPPGVNIVRLENIKDSVPRNDKTWLYHKNMAGLVPAWGYLLENNIAQNYDWLLNVELDHFTDVHRVRTSIPPYLKHHEITSNESVMLMYGNAFIFNQKYVELFEAHYNDLKVIATDQRPYGCPEPLRDMTHWPSCAQDVAYPNLAFRVLKPSPRTFGKQGCLQKYKHGNFSHLGCYELKSDKMKPNDAIRTLAVMHGLTEEQAQEYLKDFRGGQYADQWKRYYDGREAPILHHVSTTEGHRIAMDLFLGIQL
eukprot:m.342237 g.342237  ORF g.342237 m.342237 type:complete len:332 (-) comp21132_c0_seq1:77-1072(-)